MNFRTQKIGEILVRARVVDQLQLRSALATHENWGGRLAHVIAEMGLADEDTIVDTLARALNVPRIRLGNLPRDGAALGKIDVTFAEEHGVFPVQLKDHGKVLLVAMADPSDLETIDEIGRRARARVQVFIAGEREIKTAIDRHYRGREPAPQPARGPVHRPRAEEEDEDEFKIVDVSGKTVMRRLADIDPSLAAQEQAARSAPPLAGTGSDGPSAADLLDDILGGSTGPAGLTAEELQRLQTVQSNQEKSAKILRAVTELLREKGFNV